MKTVAVTSRFFAALLLLLGSSQPPQEARRAVGLFHSWSGGGLLLAHAEGDRSEDDEQGGGEELPPNGAEDSKAGDAETEGGESAEAGKQAGSLRGAAAGKKPKAPKPFSQKELGNVFESLLQSLNQGGDGTLMEYSKEAQRLNDLLDSMFPPRLQAAPKYNGALECINEVLHRDVLSGPGNKKRSSHALQQAYNFLRSPPMMLVVPALFIELREAADRRLWEEQRQAAQKLYERMGETVPSRYLLSAEEVTAEELEEGKLIEEEMTEEELLARVKLINGWLKQQFRLRLYHKKRVGTLKGNPQDHMSEFDAGEDIVPVSVADVHGLGYAAELDPAPAVEEEENTQKQETPQNSEL